MNSLSSDHRYTLPDSTQLLLLKACLSDDTKESVDAWNKWIDQNQYKKNDFQKTGRLLPQVFDNLDFGSQRLLSLAYKKMTQAKVDDPLLAELKGYYRYVWVRNQTLRQQLQEIVNLFNQEKVKHIVIKGFSIIEKFYKDWGARSVLDLDVAIHPEDWTKAITILRNNGWSLKCPEQRPEWIQKSLVHAISFVKNSNELDLHFRFIHYPLDKKTERNLWLEAQFHTANHLLLRPEHQLICSFVHGFQGKEEAMRTIADSTFIIRNTQLDWNALIETAQSGKLIIPVSVFIQYLITEKFVEIPSEIINQITSLSISTKELNYFNKYSQLAKMPASSNGFKEVRLKFLISSVITSSWLRRMQLLIDTYRFSWGIKSLGGLFFAFVWTISDKLIFPKRKIVQRKIPFQKLANGN